MRKLFWIASLLGLFWLLGTVVAGLWLLPPMLLNAPLPARSEAQRQAVREALLRPGDRWESRHLLGGEGRNLEVWRLRRPRSQGVVLFLHGFGDDAWGTLGRAAELPEWDAVGFTFRGRDRHPEIPCTLGGWERGDVVAVVRQLEREGVSRARILIAAWSQGAGVALLGLADLERQGGPLGGALLECPFEDIGEAASNHVRLALGPFEILARPAEWLALRRAGKRASFVPGRVSPAHAADDLRTPIALVTGDADPETPAAGVRRIASRHPDLTVVAGAGHCQASGRLPGGWKAWALERIRAWGLIRTYELAPS